MLIVPVIIFAAIILMAISAVAAFTWTARRGEFDHLDQTAESIFDTEEPIGELSDIFPDARTRQKAIRENITLRPPISSHSQAASAEPSLPMQNQVNSLLP
jgi:cbb3-type cytochrome oxidase maturation protein